MFKVTNENTRAPSLTSFWHISHLSLLLFLLLTLIEKVNNSWVLSFTTLSIMSLNCHRTFSLDPCTVPLYCYIHPMFLELWLAMAQNIQGRDVPKTSD